MITDGHKGWLNALGGAFSSDIDYAMLVKPCGASRDSAKGAAAPAAWLLASRIGLSLGKT
jgi:hypothetical protein